MRLILAAALPAALSASVLTLGGCNGAAPAPKANANANKEIAPDNAPHVILADAVIRLPAAKGAPGVAYFTITQDTGAPNTLVAVHVDGAGRAEMHESATTNGITSMATVPSVKFGPEKPLEFKPGGYHVMLFDVGDQLKAGTDAEITLTLGNGDKVSTFAKVENLGGGMGGMGGM
jgi:copper(I)-binding protein